MKMRKSCAWVWVLLVVMMMMMECGEGAWNDDEDAAKGDHESDEIIGRDEFPKGFVFGTAASAYQVEGMAHREGRGPSIWDAFILNNPGFNSNSHPYILYATIILLPGFSFFKNSV